MKKFVSLLLAVSMMISLVACGNQKADKYCTSCGSGMAKSDSFCPECGTAVGGAVTSSSANDADEKTTATTTKTTIVKQDKPSITKPTTTTAKPTTTTTTATAGSTTATTTTKPTTTTATTAKPTTTKTTTATTTSHKHTYSKYVCTGCGEIDKTHAYEYLIEWIKVYGTADGSHINFDYYDNSDEYTRYSLTYDASDKRLYVNKGCYHNKNYFYSCLRLDNNSSYISFMDCEVVAYIDPSEFTSNSPLTKTQYSGLSDNKWDMIELARLSTIELIEWLDWLLNGYKVGVTIKDLGFTSYEI